MKDSKKVCQLKIKDKDRHTHNAHTHTKIPIFEINFFNSKFEVFFFLLFLVK